MYTERYQNLWLRSAKKGLVFLLAMVMVFSSMSMLVSAAEEKVTGIEFLYDETDYDSSTNSLQLLIEGEKVNLEVLATISSSDGTSKKNVTSQVTWKSSNTNYVKVENGVLTGVGKGKAKITATYNNHSIYINATSDYFYDTVTIMDNNSAAPAKAEGEVGKSYTYKLSGTKNGVTEDITAEATWTTSNASVATVNEGTINFVGVGTATITAKYKGKSDTIAITVTSPYKSIVITPNEQIELEVGGDDYNLAAIATLKNGETVDVTKDGTWTSSNTNVVTVEEGVIKAVAAGKTTVSVSHQGTSSSIDVVVRNVYQSIRLSPENEYHMFIHEDPLQIKAEVLSNANVISDVTQLAQWTTSDPVVAKVTNGVVTPKAVGTTKITASYKGVSRSITVTVYPSITALTVDTESVDGFVKSSEKLPTVKGKTFDGSLVDVSKLVQWTSNDEKVAIIEDGKWVAKQIGETTLTAKIKNIEAEVKVTVNKKPVKLIPDSSNLNIVLGKDTAYPKITVVNEDGEEEDVTSKVTWSTSNESLILKETQMKGTEVATVNLTAKYLNKTTTIKVRIDEEIVKLEADPELLELNPNKSKSVKIVGYYKDGRSVVLSSKVELSSSDTKVASVKGKSIKALSAGNALITGTYQGKTVSIKVVVTPKLKSLSISDKNTNLTVGGTFTVKVTANYVNGSPVDVTEQAVWTSSKSSVATVKDGKITAVGKGTTTIKATYGGKSVSIRVVVK